MSNSLRTPFATYTPTTPDAFLAVCPGRGVYLIEDRKPERARPVVAVPHGMTLYRRPMFAGVRRAIRAFFDVVMP